MAGLLGEVENWYGLRFDDVMYAVWGTEEEQAQEKEVEELKEEAASKAISRGASRRSSIKSYGSLMDALNKHIDTEMADLETLHEEDENLITPPENVVVDNNLEVGGYQADDSKRDPEA